MVITKQKNNSKSTLKDRLVLGIFLVLVGSVLAGCKSQPEPDNRPSWVREAEARLQQPAAWQVSGSGVGSRNETETRSSFFGSGAATTATSGSQGSGGRQREAVSSAARKPVAEPVGVEWSETKITVSVED